MACLYYPSQQKQIRIVEMGANHKRKLNFAKLRNLTMDILQILVKAHLEGFGGVAGVR
jgi:hypothetical protein